MKYLTIIFLSGICFAQDSTFIRTDYPLVIDSVAFQGIAEYTPDGYSHYVGNYSHEHQWVDANDHSNRICAFCLRWEYFHRYALPIYQLSPYFEAVSKVRKLMK